MIRASTFFIVLFFSPVLTSCSDASSEEWLPVVSNGFGIRAQNTVPEVEVFEGWLYASTAVATGGLAKLYRSQTGDVGSWQDVTPGGSDSSIHSFGTSELDGGYLWCGTGSGSGAMIYRTQDGVTWSEIAPRGFGNPALTGAAPHMVVFQGTDDTAPYLYAGVGSHGVGAAGQVWRLPYASSDPAGWERLVDFSTSDPSVTIITYFYVWNDTLYFGTDGGGQLWQTTDGSSFAPVPGFVPGFGDSANFVISSLVEFDDALFATTTNYSGGELWKTHDGVEWVPVTADAFGKGNAVNELRSLRTSFGKLWVTAYTQTEFSAGTPIWRSDDGIEFTQANEDGFGDANNSGQNAVTIGFGDYQYWGGPNYVDGGQVWRARMQ